MKIITIVGARPQFIKAAAFSKVFRKENTEILVHTGQHYDPSMSDIFFEELQIPKPDYNLEIGSGSHGMQTGRMLEKIEEIIITEKPDGVLVYGDTNSTLAGALAASKLNIPVFHIEAGLRSYNMEMPEEQNRILTDHISRYLFCPTQTAVDNLVKEGVTTGVFKVGDIMYDAVLNNLQISKEKYDNGEWLKALKKDNPTMQNIEINNYYLATIHRPVNTDNPENIKKIFTAFNKLDKPVLLPLHLRTVNLIKNMDLKYDNIIIVKPIGYLLMLYVLKNAYLAVTDSGGLQKEAYFVKTPCVTLRNETEWVETLENGWNILSKIDEDAILSAIHRPLDFLNLERPLHFGDGKSAEKMVKIITKNN